MVIKIRGRKHWLWRAADDEAEVPDFLIQPRRCAKSAKRLLRKLLKKQGFAPTQITTDKLRSYGAAIRHERLSAVHDQGLRANNRAENSHLMRHVDYGEVSPQHLIDEREPWAVECH